MGKVKFPLTTFFVLLVIGSYAALGTESALAQSAGQFSDTSGHWAERAIAQVALKGIIKGYPDGSYKPNNPVTRLEAVVMMVRVMGLESEAATKTTIPSSFKNPEFVQPWGKGYVAVAVERGVIAGDDLTFFRGAEAATRLDVVVFAVRAMGLSDQANNLSSSILNFTDASSIPAWARGFVYVAVQQGLIVGNPDGTFKPGSLVTRAEIASILARVDDRLDNTVDSNEIRGTLVGIPSAESVRIRRSTGVEVALPVARNALLYKSGNKLSRLQDLVIGDDVRGITSSGSIVFLEAEPPSVTVDGTIEAVSTSPQPSIRLKKTDGVIATYYLSPSTKVTVDGQPSSLSALLSGQEATVKVRNGAVTEIASRNVRREVKGYLSSVITGDRPIITVENEKGERQSFLVPSSASVSKDGRSAKISDLVVTDEVILELRGDTVVAINAKTTSFDVEGTLVKVEYLNPPVLTVKDKEGVTKSYPVANNVTYRRDGKAVGIGALRSGDEVYVRVSQGLITRVDASSVLEELDGTVQSILLSASPKITILTSDGQERTLNVSPNVVIRREGSRINLAEVKPGSYVEAKVESGEVIRLDVETFTLLKDIKGTILYIVRDANVIVLSTADKQTKEIHVDSSTLFVRGGRIIEFEDLKLDDKVIVVGSETSGIFRASVVVATNVSG